MNFGKVAVLFGGTSAERDISLLSGNAVLEALRARGVDAHAVDPATDDLASLKQQGFARAFIVLHGRGGEDGTVQGLLDCIGLPYTGSGVMASALGLDKWRCKMIWRACGLPTPDCEELTADSDWAAIEARLGLPIFVKPVHEGSSVGAVKVTEPGKLRAAWQEAAKYDARVLAEVFVDGQELTVPFLGERILPSVRIVAPGGNYDFEHKYYSDETQYFCPSGLREDEEAELARIVRRSVDVLGASGWGRVDVLRDRDGRFWLLEINTVPGMTSHSLVPMSAKVTGMDFEELCVQILAGAGNGH